ncbi:hypothetical protein ASF61_02165 [Duganella sp. Leaf126]|uniref:DUF2946 family protein n=1 Tax=Duganella sp. Leaf126 TaxID=1736266 RepID=UPI0006F7860B|nr:DUF2946 family protein [Duganella sp. Leaf126]KQQ47471.1 hypothetical protein ASF61_02165 [Duganella sp. Leaf126]
MDEIVRQALAKWPDVPHCYGWLALDARGHWRMRDERAQHLELPGDKLTNAALVGFINRNYAADQRGCWYFQNGPQRVYVQLAATPYIVRTDPAAGWLLHTGTAMPAIETVALTGDGALVVAGNDVVAQLDDRDIAQVLPRLRLHGVPVSDEALLAWLDDPAAPLMLADGDRQLAVERVHADQLGRRFGFISVPTAAG